MDSRGGLSGQPAIDQWVGIGNGRVHKHPASRSRLRPKYTRGTASPLARAGRTRLGARCARNGRVASPRVPESRALAPVTARAGSAVLLAGHPRHTRSTADGVHARVNRSDGTQSALDAWLCQVLSRRRSGQDPPAPFDPPLARAKRPRPVRRLTSAGLRPAQVWIEPAWPLEVERR